MSPTAKCLNPVFVKWLEEMRDELDSESKYRTVYNRAAKAMKAHDRYLEHPKDCAEVKFVGPKLRDRLIKRHNELHAQGADPAVSKNPGEASGSRKLAKATPSVLPQKSRFNHVEQSDGSDGGQGSPSWPAAASARATTKRVPKVVKAKPPQTPSGSESERGPAVSATPAKAIRTKLSQPRNAPTPQSVRRMKRLAERPRLSTFIPAPAATSDIEPGTDTEEPMDTRNNLSFEPVIFPAGTFTIQLILDAREVKNTKNRDYMLHGLHKRGVSAEKRALEIGDVCWVARSNRAVDETQAECVLDFVVERKRLDDLKSSILDGRFHEQKFRLKHTGISHIYYLVEDYDADRIERQWKEQINTALSSTQVIDKFFLKETASIEDTLDYLATLHKTISRLYEYKTIYVIPPQLIKRHRFLALKQDLDTKNDGNTYHTTYQSYQYLNQKNGFYTLQDNMARMLQCIRGLSEEKIAALIEKYPTPRSLYEAFRESEEKSMRWEDSAPQASKGKGKKRNVPKPEMALAEMEEQGRRKIGPVLSKHIYDVFMA